MQGSAQTGRSRTGAGEIDLGSGRHADQEENSLGGLDSQAALSAALTGALRLASVEEADLPGLLEQMIPEISESLAQRYSCRLHACRDLAGICLLALVRKLNHRGCHALNLPHTISQTLLRAAFCGEAPCSLRQQALPANVSNKY